MYLITPYTLICTLLYDMRSKKLLVEKTRTTERTSSDFHDIDLLTLELHDTTYFLSISIIYKNNMSYPIARLVGVDHRALCDTPRAASCTGAAGTRTVRKLLLRVPTGGILLTSYRKKSTVCRELYRQYKGPGHMHGHTTI